MPTVTVTITSINPKPGRIHEVTYEYTIQCNDDECARGATFNLEVELTGADKWSDDQLGKAIDQHTVTCDPDTCQITGTRSFPAATSLLDEDWGKGRNSGGPADDGRSYKRHGHLFERRIHRRLLRRKRACLA